MVVESIDCIVRDEGRDGFFCQPALMKGLCQISKVSGEELFFHGYGVVFDLVHLVEDAIILAMKFFSLSLNYSG